MRFEVKPDLNYEWHRWFAWYPVFIRDEETGKAMWVWWESVERIFKNGAWEEETYYRLPG